jgi:MAPEG family
MSQPFTAAVTLLALLVYFLITGSVARARAQYGVKAPAVVGNEHFERAYRVQMNTLEQMALFLPALWLYAVYVSDRGAAVGGLIWVVGRVVTRSPTRATRLRAGRARSSPSSPARGSGWAPSTAWQRRCSKT